MNQGESRRHYAVFETAAGWMAALASETGLLRLVLPRASAAEALDRLGTEPLPTTANPEYFAGLTGRLRHYFRGEPAPFDDRLDLSGATVFQREVWRVTRLIPYGETRSYGWVAAGIGKKGAARAVGRALGQNPLPILVPCHRVVHAGGAIGGFSGGLEMKRYLLRLESKRRRREAITLTSR